MSQNLTIEYCQQRKVDCFAFGNFGKCKALIDTLYEHECPFYKPQKVYKEERISSLVKLEAKGRFDLIQKYELTKQ